MELIKERLFDTCYNKLFEKAYNDFFILQDKQEFYDFIKFLLINKRKVKKILEIGVFTGGDTYILNSFFPLAKKIIIDIFSFGFIDAEAFKEMWSKERIKNFKKTIPQDMIKFIRKNIKGDIAIIASSSHCNFALSTLKKMLKKEKIDLIFIDGDHSYSGVKFDFETYFPFLKKGGHMAFHDIYKNIPGFVEVDSFWENIEKKELIFENYKVVKEIINRESDYTTHGIGVIEKL